MGDIPDCPHDIGKIANELENRLTTQKIPSDYEPEGHYYERIAHVRDTYTNYEELLHELNECVNHCSDCPPDVRNAITRRSTGECWYMRLAHDDLRSAAQYKAKALYDSWREARK